MAPATAGGSGIQARKILRITGTKIERIFSSQSTAPTFIRTSGLLQGYRVDIRTGGEGDFTVHVAHTLDPEPRALLEGLMPMTWYEFRAAAINAKCTGPPGPVSEPLLTRSAVDQIGGGSASPMSRLADEELDDSMYGHDNDDGGRGGGQRRRSLQPDGADLSHERETHARMLEHEAELTADIERSAASVAAWEQVFTVRHGRAPSAEDRDESRVLRDEANNLRVTRHSLAAAKLAVVDAEKVRA